MTKAQSSQMPALERVLAGAISARRISNDRRVISPGSRR